jgi:pimeloyl-ACP methyl ester carboxylesterase
MDDVRAVMEEVGSSRAALMGFSEGCAMSVMFAASYPERVSHLICFGGFARYASIFPTKEDPKQVILESTKLWGTGAFVAGIFPDDPANKDAVAQFAKFERLSSTPGSFKALSLLNLQIDIRSIFPTIRVPALVLHRSSESDAPCLKRSVAFGSRRARSYRSRFRPDSATCGAGSFPSRSSGFCRGIRYNGGSGS